MRLTEVIDEEYKTVSGTVVDRVVFPKREERLQYEVMPQQNTHANSVYALRDSYNGKEKEVPSQLWYEVNGEKIIRPLMFRENLQARVDDFETLKNENGSTRTIEDRLRLFITWLDSCTGVAYSSQNEDDFMIIPECKELIMMPKDFCDEYVQIDYASLQGKGTQLKRSQAKYDQLLTESEVMSHPAWIASVEEDITLLCTYTSIVFKHIPHREGKVMGFYLRNQIEKDQLRSLFVDNSDNNSYADGYDNLDNGSAFLRGTSPSS